MVVLRQDIHQNIQVANSNLSQKIEAEDVDSLCFSQFKFQREKIDHLNI